MDFKLRIDERASIELRDWMYNDILLTLWESRPKFVKTKEEGSEEEKDKVVMDGDLPVSETLNRGVMKLNLIDWLKKSPAKPVYNSSAKKPANADGTTIASGEGGDANDSDIIHRFMYFYPSELLIVPEFRYENKVDSKTLKKKDIDQLVEYLELKEEADRKRKAEEAAKDTPVAAAGGAKGKADAKKAPPKAAGKGAAVAEDKNTPQPITVEYPEAPAEGQHMILERSFLDEIDLQAKGKKPPPSAALLTGKASKSPWGDLDGKLSDRSKVLLGKYQIIRPSDYSLAVKLRLNKDEEVAVIEEVPEEAPPVDIKKKGK